MFNCSNLTSKDPCINFNAIRYTTQTSADIITSFQCTLNGRNCNFRSLKRVKMCWALVRCGKSQPLDCSDLPLSFVVNLEDLAVDSLQKIRPCWSAVCAGCKTCRYSLVDVGTMQTIHNSTTVTFILYPLLSVPCRYKLPEPPSCSKIIVLCAISMIHVAIFFLFFLRPLFCWFIRVFLIPMRGEQQVFKIAENETKFIDSFNWNGRINNN